MITAEEARKRNLDMLEEQFKDQLSVIEKYVVEACAKGRICVRIENAGEIFPDVVSLATFLRLRYGYEESISNGDLVLSW